MLTLQHTMKDKKLILGVQYLRGLAALGVLLCHYSSSLLHNSFLSNVLNYGQMGVPAFFLVSGFIIAYSLQQARYSPTQFLKFLARRSVRIDPPYFVTIILTLILFNILSAIPSYKGSAIPFIPQQFVAHILYVVPFTKYAFYNHIFWTLCVEFQFYIIIGLFYYLSSGKLYQIGFLILFSLTGFIDFPNKYYLVFNYAPIFCLGISLATAFINKTKTSLWLPAVFLLTIAFQNSIAVALLLLICCGVILRVKQFNKLLFFLGEISYSLYLTHMLTFTVVFGIFKRLNMGNYLNELFTLMVAVIIAVIVGFLFNKLVEKPALRLSKRIPLIKTRMLNPVENYSQLG